MKRLPLKFKKIFKIIFEDDKYNINKLSNKKTNYKNIMDSFNKINQLFKENDCDIYEINKIINSDKINDENVKKFREFVYLKNKHILEEASTTKYWDNNINKIMRYCNTTYKLKPSYDLIENAFVELEKKFIMNWGGFWSTISINDSGKIKNIDIFDMDDYNFIINYINKSNK